ncbi:MAG: hypothetical protein KBI32_05690 [Phycisphaerae bacterium]|nr:hypothetical protein [Phycisphaerae bacterium]
MRIKEWTRGVRLSREGCFIRVSTLLLVLLGLDAPAGKVWANLITNGNFESGDGGFSTEYFYTCDLTSPGTVVVGFDPCDHHPLAASYGDHTSGLGRMLIANGSTSGSAAVWEQTVCVSPNTEYAFYYWLSTWTPSVTQQTQIRCLFDGIRTGPAGFTSPQAGDWTVVLFRWKSGAASQVNIRLVDRTGTVENNDFALDDIGMLATGGDNVLLTSSTLGGSVYSPGEGAFLYPPDETVTLEAKCDPGYEFAGWAGEFSDPGVRIQTQMDTDRVATAVFRKLAYPVTIRASAALPNEFTVCVDSSGRLAALGGAMESQTPNGLVLNERHGLCGATYRFPVFRPAAGIEGVSGIVVNVYGSMTSSGPTVWIAGSGPHRPIAGNTRVSFGPNQIVELLEDWEEPVYWLPVQVNAAMGDWDIASVYVSYECPGIPEFLLRRFHDHFSVYRALDRYAGDRGIRDLYAQRQDEPFPWEAVVQTMALAEDRADADGISVFIELRSWMNRWRLPLDSSDLATLAACDTKPIVSCLDRAVSRGRSYVFAYAAALSDGVLSGDEVSLLNLGLAEWRADLSALETAMKSVFEFLCAVGGSQDGFRRTAAETMILAMLPWMGAKPDAAGRWTVPTSTYLGQVIRGLQEFEAQ